MRMGGRGGGEGMQRQDKRRHWTGGKKDGIRVGRHDNSLQFVVMGSAALDSAAKKQQKAAEKTGF